MGKSVSVYVDDEILEVLKGRDISLSQAVREALRIWLREKERTTAFSRVKEILTETPWTDDAEKAEQDIMKDRGVERW